MTTSAGHPDRERPNVLWLSTHDINPHLGCYAGIWPDAALASTPNLDALAAEGVRFDQAIAAAPVCAPARSAIVTGCFPPAIGTMHMRTRAVPPPEIGLLPAYFRAAGYWTANTAFTDFQVDIPGPVYDAFGDQVHWRDRPDPDQPFFLAVHQVTTHESQLYLSEAEHAAATPDVTPEQRVDPADVVLPPYHPDTPVFRAAWARYYELIAQMDHRVGRWLADLAADGLERDTIVVFWSDHGLGMPGAKRWASEAGVREPLIIRWPARLTPGVVPHVVSTYDLMPTMLAMCGISIPEHVHAQPLIDADGRLTDDLRPYAFSARDRMGEQPDRSRSVRDNRFRYTRHWHPDRPAMGHCAYPDHLATWAELRRLLSAEAQQELAFGRPGTGLTPRQRRVVDVKPAEELYDISVDPHEEHDLAADPTYAAERERLSAALDDWLRTVGDLGDLAEEALLEQWRPGGVAPTVAEPTAVITDGRVRLDCATDGALLGWTTCAARPADPSPARPFSGYTDEPGRWSLYTEPFDCPDGDVIIRAWRLGWQPSAEVLLSSSLDR